MEERLNVTVSTEVIFYLYLERHLLSTLMVGLMKTERRHSSGTIGKHFDIG
jgi:hypothetical protein